MTDRHHLPGPIAGEVVVARPEATRKHGARAGIRYVVAQVDDFRDDPDPATYLTLVEEPFYRHCMEREGGVVADWSPWHVVVGPEEVMRPEPVAVEVKPHGQYALFNPAA